MEQLIFNRELTLGDSNKVTLQLRSTLEISILERFEHEMIAFLRRKLNNDSILLEKEVLEEEEQSQKLYTSADKYEYMLTQNPDLKLLKDRLGLDFEY
jgi:DNA polymerase-3 subunit gamma/tau